MQKITLSRGKGYRVENGHPWVYHNEIEGDYPDAKAGDLVTVYNFKDHYIGTGFYNPQSQIRVRLLTRKQQENIDTSFFRERLQSCRSYREKLGYTEQYRLVFGEGDFLPGLVIDKFGDTLVMQNLTFGMDRWKPQLVEILQEMYSPRGIYERNDVSVRKLEGLEEKKGFLTAPFDTKITMEQDGIRYAVDLDAGQKTGFFLDQRENRLALDPVVKGASVLDCFCYTGSFSLAAAHFGAASVTGLDISEAAIQQAMHNASLNQLQDRCQFECKNAFDYLPQLLSEKRSFGVVITDPPAFTKNRQGMDSAARGYKEINLRAMKLLQPGGFLLAFSCSHFMNLELFFQILHEAASDAGRSIRQVAQLMQSKDHPVLWDVEETFYLKGFLLQIL